MAKFVFLLGLLELVLAGDYSVTKYKFLGLRNVWHTDTQNHISVKVGDFDGYDPSFGNRRKREMNEALDVQNFDWELVQDERRKKIVELCANQCVLYQASCDAFYVKLKGNGNCHLVSEDNVNRTIGHGQDLLKIYYVKQQIGPKITQSRPPALEPPCDQDFTTLTPDDCGVNGTIPSVAVDYSTCDDFTDTFSGTINIVPDAKCQGEDRLLLCEFEGLVTTNINPQTSMDMLKQAFLKNYQDPQPFRTIDGDMIEFIEMTFPGGPREVRRIIVRSVTDIQVHKLSEGKFTFYAGDKTEEIAFKFETDDTCLVHINLAGAVQHTRDVAYKAEKLRMDIISVQKPTEPIRTAFKIDIFVNEIKFEMPTNSNSGGGSVGNSTLEGSGSGTS